MDDFLTVLCVCGHRRGQHTASGVCTENDLDDADDSCACSSFLPVAVKEID